jgi:hypothetical protein
MQIEHGAWPTGLYRLDGCGASTATCQAPVPSRGDEKRGSSMTSMAMFPARNLLLQRWQPQRTGSKRPLSAKQSP